MLSEVVSEKTESLIAVNRDRFLTKVQFPPGPLLKHKNQLKTCKSNDFRFFYLSKNIKKCIFYCVLVSEPVSLRRFLNDSPKYHQHTKYQLV